jgi:putative heme-binding domain-containing protein
MVTPPADDSAAPLVRLVLVFSTIVIVVVVLCIALVLRDSESLMAPPRDATEERALELTEAPDVAPPELVAVDVEEGDLARAITVREGFAVDLVYVVPRELGSWVSLTIDGRGRLIAGDQSGGLYRVTPAPIGAPAAQTSVEPIELPVGGAQGLLVVDDDLYVVVNGSFAEGPGVYRVRDTDGDDRYDEHVLMRAIPGGGGEHGRHGIVRGPDGLLYVVVGNHIGVPAPERSAVPRVWGEDLLLPRLWDARGHAVGVMAPGGWICRFDPRDGPDAAWELISIGYRNPYDIAFNADGELFTFDADMEWDMGAPWYRPTRVNHVTSGSEFGWRSGTGKWPPHYPDSLPAVIDIGPASPTGVLFGYGTAFPDRHRRALYLLDWTFGTMYAVHLEPDGASYRATREVFLAGRPLPLTDAVVNDGDGAMYFAVGGRGVASAIYRVRYAGDAGDPAPVGPATAGAAARERRRALEAWHHADAPASAVEAIGAALADDDRHVRYAARVALEHQPVERWGRSVIFEPDPRARLAGLLALARVGGPAQHGALVAALAATRWDDLAPDLRLELLRVWALCFIRTGAPDAGTARALAASLEPRFPTGDERLDRELCDLLVYLQSPTIVARTLPLMEREDETTPDFDEELLARSDAYGQVILKMAAAPPQRQQVHYALALRNAEHGWTPARREQYFGWFQSARRTTGGNSFTGFLDAIRADALARLDEAERERYAALGAAPVVAVDPATLPRGPGRVWTVDDVVALAADGLAGRDYERGRQLYTGAACAACHRFAGTGTLLGPDLTGVASRFSLRDLVEAIVEPNRTITDQLEQTEIVLDDDSVVVGRIVAESEAGVRVMPMMLAPDHLVDVPAARIRSRRPSKVSAMMPRLLDPLSPDEVLDLLAYLLSGGDPRASMFAGMEN